MNEQMKISNTRKVEISYTDDDLEERNMGMLVDVLGWDENPLAEKLHN